MDTMLAYGRRQAAEAAGAKMKAFDWMKAAQLIKEKQPKEVEAYLTEDWEYTAGLIYQSGRPVNGGAYLCSSWAIPVMDMDGEIIECYLEGDLIPKEWSHEWSEEAKKLLETN